MRYYTYCLFSPSLYNTRGRAVEARYPNAPIGFVFHDSEKPLDVSDIRLPLWYLYKLVLRENKSQIDYDDNVLPRRAIALRSDEHTIAATFSMSGFPVPHRKLRAYYREQEHELFPAPTDENVDGTDTDHLTGWLISDVRTLSSPSVDISFGDVYDKCGQLVKLAGGCPCDLLKTGECMEFTVLPQLPDSFLGPMRTTYDVDAQWLVRKNYRMVDDFEYVKPGYTIEGDFGQAVRPYDSHEFAVVEQRKEELKKRGQQRKFDNEFRQNECSRCHFSRRDNKGQVVDCGFVRSCKEATSEAEAWQILESKYDATGFETMEGFTPKERDYLIHLGGQVVFCNAVTGARYIESRLAGFVRHPLGWVYRVAANRGQLARWASFGSYKAFYESLKNAVHIAPPDQIPDVDISKRAKMGCAFAGESPWVYVYRKGQCDLYRVTYTPTGNGGHVFASSVRTSYVYEDHLYTIELAENPSHWFSALGWPAYRAKEPDFTR